MVNEKQRRKVRFLGKSKAVKLVPERNAIELEDGRYILYKKLLIATGGQPKRPEFAQDLSNGIQSKVSFFRNVR